MERIFSHGWTVARAIKTRASLAVVVKIAIQKVSISTLTINYLKNTPTIISIPLFIFFK